MAVIITERGVLYQESIHYFEKGIAQ
jgi:hypothetical protein